jgi:predicted metalloprotease with PDZ domain
MLTASNFIDDVPFTDISKYTLDKYKDQYYNVYQKGALIGMCLDIKLRKLSGGKYGIQNLIADLSKKYGKNQAFQDEALFDEITKLTYPEIGDFLKKYVGGPEKLPFEEVFNEVGVSYVPEVANQEFSLGFENNAITIAQVDNKPKLAISKSELLNDQGKALGLASGDILVKLNGETIPDLGPEIGPFIAKHQSNMKEGGTISYSVLRNNEAGEQKEVELKAPLSKVEKKKKYLISFDTNAPAEKVALRQSWLSAK